MESQCCKIIFSERRGSFNEAGQGELSQSYDNFSHRLSVLGTYIRSSDGRIFAIRAANKAKTAEESTAAPSKGKTMTRTDILWDEQKRKMRHKT